MIFINKDQEVGATLLKHRLLKRLGWSVVQVPYFVWQTMAPGKRKEYLSRKLALRHV